MSIAIGTRIGPYEIVALIGAGGMGEVYRARDSRLGRDVAIKVLPAELASDVERLARFEREAKVLAALNHPNIAVLYGIERIDGQLALAMELVEGEGLDQRIARGPIAIDEAVPMATQIAEALEAAHEKGIVHRDLKPANVKVRADGTVKVLDFGLAKAWEEQLPGSDLAVSPTITGHHTRAGVILGTASYMSPEQARGKPVDKRADIWAFGCLVYEMLAGRKAFEGETVSDTLAAVLTKEPEWSALPKATPPSLVRLLHRCLERDPKQRLRDIGDARIELGTGKNGPPALLAPPVVPPGRFRWLAPLLAAITGATLLLAVFLGYVALQSSRHVITLEARALHVQYCLPKGEVLAFGAQGPGNIAISPDGTKLVYAVVVGATQRLRLHAMDRDDSVEIQGTDGGFAPFFSPDGKWIGYFDPTGLKKVAVAGGTPILISDKARFSNGATWSDDGSIFFVPQIGAPISRISSSGGPIETVTRLEPGEQNHRMPEALPGGKALLYAVGYGTDWDRARIVAQRLDTDKRTVLIEGGTNPRYIPGGYLVYARGDALQAVAFDPKSLRVSGSPVEVARGVWLDVSGQSNFDFSRTGILASLSPESAGAKVALAWIDRHGRAEELRIETPENLISASLSPEGRRAALIARNALFVLDLDRLSLRRLTLPGRAMSVCWSADGKRVIFGMEKDRSWRVFSKSADDSGTEELAFPSEYVEAPNGAFPDSRRILVTRSFPDGSAALVARTVGAPSPKGEDTVFVRSPSLGGGLLTPNGRWLAYATSDSGRPEVFVRPASADDRRWQVSVGGGGLGLFSRSGKELFYWEGTKLMAVPVATGEEFSIGTPIVVFDRPDLLLFDIAPDGRRFFGAIDPHYGARARIDLTTGWLTAITRKIEEAGKP